jgi:uncharacterized protein (DUF2249 family)
MLTQQIENHAQDHRAVDHALADEHAVLLAEVRLRERAVRAAIGAGRWPDAEIDALVAYLRYELLDQASQEESLLFPRTPEGLAGPHVHALVEDHVHLRDLSDRLGACGLDGSDHEPAVLVDLLDDLEEFLAQHLRAEEALLATSTTGGVESLRRPYRCHLWFPLTEGSLLDLDALPHEFAYRAALERFTRMRPGQRLLVRSRDDVEALWNLLSRAYPRQFGWVYLEEGPRLWCAEVIRRARESD